MGWLKKVFSNAATQTVLAAALGGAVVSVGEVSTDAMTNKQKIDLDHIKNTAILGALVGVSALWKSKPGSPPPDAK